MVHDDVIEGEALSLRTRLEKLNTSNKDRNVSKEGAIDLKSRTFLQAINLIGDSDEEQAPEEQK